MGTKEYRTGLIYQMLHEIGEDPTREGLLGTPERVVKMWGEMFRGYDESQKPKITTFPNGKDGIVYDQMIVDTGKYYSQCEHHMVPFFGSYWFGYIPSKNGGVVGLSKVARIVGFHSAKLQIQERLVSDVVEDIWNELVASYKEPPLGMGLVMKGTHLCKTMRGVRNEGEMTTIYLKGIFLDKAKDEFLRFVK